MRFEEKFPIECASKRYPPNLDVYALSHRDHLAIESKMLEYLAIAKPVSIESTYDYAIEKLAHESWQAQVLELRANPSRFRFFSAGQIVKHYLGLKSARLERVRLLYLFWEPRDHGRHPLFAQHRAEVNEFASAVEDENLLFDAMSYRDLFADWVERPSIRRHVRRLRDRYDVSIFGEA
jgi:hypothetical protein